MDRRKLPSAPPRRRRRTRTGGWFLLACLVTAAALLVSVVGAYQWQYRGQIYPGVTVAGQVAGGLTPAQLSAQLTARRDALLAQGLWLDLGGELVNLPLEVSASDPDLARAAVSYDVARAVAAAYGVGRQGTPWTQLVSPLKLRWLSRTLPVPYTLDRTMLLQLLRSALEPRETAPHPATLQVNADGGVTVVAEREGLVFDFAAAVPEIERRLAALDATPVALRMVGMPAPIRATETDAAVQLAVAVLATSTPTFVHGERRWEVPRETFVQWLEFQRLPEADGAGEVTLGVKPEAVASFLESIAGEVEVQAQDAKFRLEDGRVAEFQASRDGLRLDVASTTRRLAEGYLRDGRREVELTVAVSAAKVATGDVNDLGIRELLGTGRSNFAGSPRNRRHNIAVGVAALNGILIARGEEFSLLKALGEVSGKTGYLPELVIKGSRTVPEFGGGLCQIGTTTFRAALKSGLPITKRQNHSFRVRYYDPPGMDATIYDPAPDFKFLNDTGATILFLAEIQGDELVFSFYGSKDGRIVEVPEKATILSTTPSGPVRYIETDELKPGEKKLVEKPAPGGTTVFTYRVTYPDGRVNEQEFKSVYRPWAETWLVGKTATSTEETVPAGEPLLP